MTFRPGRRVRLLQPAQLVAAPTAASAAIMASGFAFGWWLTVLGLFMLICSAVGFVFVVLPGLSRRRVSPDETGGLLSARHDHQLGPNSGRAHFAVGCWSRALACTATPGLGPLAARPIGSRPGSQAPSPPPPSRRPASSSSRPSAPRRPSPRRSRSRSARSRPPHLGRPAGQVLRQVLAGTLSADGSSWDRGPGLLRLSTSYVVDAQAVDSRGRPKKVTSSFTTLKPKSVLRTTVTPGDGASWSARACRSWAPPSTLR